MTVGSQVTKRCTGSDLSPAVLHPQAQHAAQRALDALETKQQTLDLYLIQPQRAANAFGNAATMRSFLQGASNLLIAMLGAAVPVYPLKALSVPVAILGLVGAAMHDSNS